MAVTTGVNELVLNEMFGLYTAAEQIMLQKLAKRIKKGATTPGWTEEKLNDVSKMKSELEAAMAKIHGKTIPGVTKAIISAHLAGVNSVNGDLKLPKTALKNTNIPLHVQRLILEANGILKGVSVQVLRNANDIYKHVVTDSSSVMLTGVETRLDATQRALNVFAAKGITGFVDKAGRNWELASYAEMAIRTTTARAALQGHIDRSSELGHDLMVVSSFGKTCSICKPWEGVPLSISGNTPGYKSLAMARSAGLFHPNCKHTLLAYFPGVTELQSQENDDEAFENTQIQRYNERQIRKHKRLEAAAMTPQASQQARSNVLKWQGIQREFIKKTGLRRKYYREGIKNRTGNPANAMFGKHVIEFDNDDKIILGITNAAQNPEKVLKQKKPAKPKQPKQQVEPKQLPHPDKVSSHELYSKMTLAELTETKVSIEHKIDMIDSEKVKAKWREELDIVEHYTSLGGVAKPNVIAKPAVKLKNHESFDQSLYEYIDESHKDVKIDGDVIMDKMPQKYTNAIERYTGQSYRAMNTHLRNGNAREDDERIHDLCVNLNAAIDKYAHGLSQNTVILRHMDRSALPDIFNDEVHGLASSIFNESERGKYVDELRNMIVGGTFSDKGFLSTSYKKGIFVQDQGVEVRMMMPKGYKNGMFVESASQFEGEREYIVNAAQEFKIMDVTVETVKSGYENIVLIVVPK